MTNSTHGHVRRFTAIWNAELALLFRAFPDMSELAERFGDRAGTKLYMFAEDIEAMWLNRYLQQHSVDVDQSLLHYYLGGSNNPPPLWDVTE